MVNDIIFLPAAHHFVKKIKDKKLKLKLQKAIEIIMNDYSAGELKQGNLAGIYFYDVFYTGINYEIVYRFEEQRAMIVVIMIGTRENFYEELKRYMKK